jgi:hypothetical protein
MKALFLDPKVISLANTLQANGPDAVAAIRRFCQKRIHHLIRGVGKIVSVQALAKIVCEKLNLFVHEVWSDVDLRSVVNLYLEQGERVFAFLETDLRPDTYGVLMRLQKPTNSGFRWVAVVDCRGEKQHRRFFTLWHEIVHRITAVDQYELPFHRTFVGAVNKDPIEKLTDIVAGDLGFFEPLFVPVLVREVAAAKRLDFDAVERVRSEFCPEASFEATLNACVSRVDYPMILVKARMALKKSERDRINSPQQYLFPPARPNPQLRAVSAVANEAAKKVSFHIPANMRIPKSSIIMRLFLEQEPLIGQGEASENLKYWTSSDGGSLSACRVNVHAKKIYDQVFALISLPD